MHPPSIGAIELNGATPIDEFRATERQMLALCCHS